MRRGDRVLPGIDMPTGQTPSVRVDPGIAITKLKKQATTPVDQNHPGDPSIHPRTHEQAA